MGAHRPRGAAPAIGAAAYARVLWRQLTSMRTALVLLFALAVAAIPGSLVPQRSVDPAKVRLFMQQHPGLAPWYERLGLFSVYASPWFSAVYLLLFISLVGCIVPRWRDLWRDRAAAPPRTPTNLSRLPAHAAGELDVVDSAAAALERAAAHLRGKRFRVEVRDGSVAAQRGLIARELGNLVFHTALLGVLAGIAVAGLWGYRGTAIVVEGGGFSNSITQFDDFTAGGRFDESQLDPFTVAVDAFAVRFETGPVGLGMPRDFRADVTVADGGAAPRKAALAVNQPLQLAGGTTVHLLAYGYAADVTVTDGAGNVAFAGPVVFLPQDGNFTSTGAIKVPDARPRRLGFEGMFLPTAVVNAQGPHSAFPDAYNPELFLNAWAGPPREETGRPESVYSLDKTGLSQVMSGGSPLRKALKPGEQLVLPDGQGMLTFNGYRHWVRLQVAHTPGVPVALGSLALAVAGVCVSLFTRPRRLWVRVTDDRVEVGGLDKVDARAGLEDDVADLLAATTKESA